jgi:hypothetical protein
MDDDQTDALIISVREALRYMPRQRQLKPSMSTSAPGASSTPGGFICGGRPDQER